jgi:hypothetical protein
MKGTVIAKRYRTRMENMGNEKKIREEINCAANPHTYTTFKTAI